jgi:DNA-directed RNA polymerase subunit RPC12/RpoP
MYTYIKMSTKSEKNIPNEFNEIDEENPDLIQRTIVDFHLCDKQGIMIPFEGICDYIHKSELVLYGTIVSPMPSEWRQTFNNSVTTVNESQNLSVDEINGMAARIYNKKNKGAHNGSSSSSSSSNFVKEGMQMQTGGSVDASGDGEKASSYALEPFNQHNIQTGDLVDGYCPRTLKWYESKILECRTDDNGEPQVKLHFQGWNNKHDEWISRFSERIVGHGTSKIIMLQAAEAALELIPWFDHDNLTKKVKTKLGGNNPPKRERISVVINGIDDWCIDYSYGNPSLWLVSSAGIWYRVASILSPNGFRGSPSADYFSFYKSAWEKYVCSSHVIMCLLDFIPTNPKLTLQVVVDEVTDRSKSMISEVVVLQNYEFLIEQISALDKPESWSIKFEFSNCTFVQQLKKEGLQFLSSGGILGMASMSSSSVAAAPYSTSAGLKRRKSLAIKYMENENKVLESMKCKRKREELPPEKKKEEKIPFNGVPVEDVKAFKLKAKNLMEDKEYWHMQTRLGEPIKPFPISSSCRFFISEESTGVFLGVWSFLAGFRKVLNIPYISLDVFQSYLISSSQPYSIRAGSSNIEKHSLHPFLSELFIAFLSAILSDSDRKRWPSMIYSDQKAMTRKEKKGTSRLVFPTFPNSEVEFVNIALAKRQAALEMEFDSSNSNSSSDSQYKCMRCMRDFLSLQGLQYHQDNNVCKRCDSGVSLKAGEINHILNAEDIERCRKFDNLSLNQHLRNGHMWVEILKLLIIEEKKLVMNNLFDPIDECSKIVDIVINDTNALPFLKPVDPIQEGVPQYWSIVSKPMDLGTVKERIKSGWYYEDISAPQKNVSESVFEEGQYIQDSYQINDGVDVYCEELKIWYPGKVLEVEMSTQEANTSSMSIGSNSNSNESETNPLQSVFIELEGWGKFNRLWLSSKSIFIRPGHGVSSNASLRHEKPEDLEMKILKLSQAPEIESSKSNAMSIDNGKSAAASSSSPSDHDAVSIEYPDRAPTNDESRRAGVNGIINDVRQVWANCELFMEESGHPFLDNARSCSQLFEVNSIGNGGRGCYFIVLVLVYVYDFYVLFMFYLFLFIYFLVVA